MSSIPVLKLVCQECGKEFPVAPDHFAQMGFRHLPKRCPTCKDIQQDRPSVVVERKCLEIYDGVEIVSLPGEWLKVPRRERSDKETFGMTILGRKFGAAWNGRIDLFALHSWESGDIVSVRVMEVTHKVRFVTEEVSTLRHGTILVHKNVPIGNTEEGKITLEKRQYLALERWDREPSGMKLVWVTAYSKTTLKGFGRQYRAEIVGAPVAEWRIGGGVRSGRAYTDGCLAIIDQDHPLMVKCYEGGEVETRQIS